VTAALGEAVRAVGWFVASGSTVCVTASTIVSCGPACSIAWTSVVKGVRAWVRSSLCLSCWSSGTGASGGGGECSDGLVLVRATSEGEAAWAGWDRLGDSVGGEGTDCDGPGGGGGDDGGVVVNCGVGTDTGVTSPVGCASCSLVGETESLRGNPSSAEGLCMQMVDRWMRSLEGKQARKFAVRECDGRM